MYIYIFLNIHIYTYKCPYTYMYIQYIHVNLMTLHMPSPASGSSTQSLSWSTRPGSRNWSQCVKTPKVLEWRFFSLMKRITSEEFGDCVDLTIARYREFWPSSLCPNARKRVNNYQTKFLQQIETRKNTWIFWTKRTVITDWHLTVWMYRILTGESQKHKRQFAQRRETSGKLWERRGERQSLNTSIWSVNSFLVFSGRFAREVPCRVRTQSKTIAEIRKNQKMQNEKANRTRKILNFLFKSYQVARSNHARHVNEIQTLHKSLWTRKRGEHLSLPQTSQAPP